MTEFRVEERPEQPYAAVVGHVTMETIPEIADRFGEVFGFLGERGVAPAGSPFLRYRVIDMTGGLVIEAAVPTVSPVAAAGDILADSLPAGRYVGATVLGHPRLLAGATADLLAWAAERRLSFDVQEESDVGERWGARLEVYDTDPSEEADLDRWQTRLAFRLAD